MAGSGRARPDFRPDLTLTLLTLTVTVRVTLTLLTLILDTVVNKATTSQG